MWKRVCGRRAIVVRALSLSSGSGASVRSRDRVSSAAAELWGAAPDVDSELCGGGPASFRELLFYPIRDFVIGRWLEL